MTSSPGWFDAFRDNGGPTLYSNSNRTPAIEDVRNILIYISFFTMFIAFLIIFPGIRKERFSTFICVTLSLFVGAVILVANFGTSWHVAQASISSPYRAFSKEKIFANVGVWVGLKSVNITLRATPVHKRNEEINYNERFYWIGPSEMKQEYHNALAKGLPFPILTIAEYLSQDGEGFCWGRRYRLAGYYSSTLLWIAFSSWLLMNVLLCAVPRYGVYAMQITGVLMLLTNAIYCLLLPRKPLTIPFEGGPLTFTYGWCFWWVLIAGITAVLVGATVTIIDTLFPNKFSTILEVDYDTPYRYFVGNDAHLFGLFNGGHNCPHHSASATSSSATETTCCGATPLSTQNSNISKQLMKTKSDASTSTTMSIPVKKATLGGGVDTVTSTIEAEVEEEREEGEDLEKESGGRGGASGGASGGGGERGVENKGFVKETGEDSDGSDVSTTIIDGKRAVSLANFGKFAAQQERERKESTHFRNRNPGASSVQRRMGAFVAGPVTHPSQSNPETGTTGSGNPSHRRSSQIHIDLSSSAAMW